MINVNDLEKIIKVVEKYNISHFEFMQENSKVVIEKGNSKECISLDNNDVISEVRKNDLHKAEVISEEDKDKVDYINSNMAGTFYLSKEENAEPFIKVNDIVTKDSVIGIIEIMKLFNEVTAGIEGEVIDILVKDKEFVEYGQPLFKVKLRGW